MTTPLLSSFLGTCEELHAQLSAGASTSSSASSGDLVRKLLDVDMQLQANVAVLLATREQQARGASLMRRVQRRQAALLRLARRMHAAQTRLQAGIERASDALSAADKMQQRSERHVPAATIVDYAERVSYSNAAPFGQAAFEGAARNLFFQGWGTPTPQQHMVAASHFASGGKASEGFAPEPDVADEGALGAAEEAPAPSQQRDTNSAAATASAPAQQNAQPLLSSAPSFRAVAAAAASSPADDADAGARVSLDFSDDEDDEFE